MIQDSDKTSGKLVLEARGLVKSFGSQTVLNEVDLEVKNGDSIVIFGPNGAGKTTLIKILANIMKSSAGELIINNLNLKDKSDEVRKFIGIVTHNTFLYGNLTIYENLDFYCRIYQVSQRKKRIFEVAEIMRLTDRLDSKINTLSRGLQQRVSIARAILHKPAILLLDEVETGLDHWTNSIIWAALKSSVDVQKSIIFTTHNMEKGLEHSNRFLILHKGKKVYDGLNRNMDISELKTIYQRNTGEL
jgi:heme exporter protein A